MEGSNGGNESACKAADFCRMRISLGWPILLLAGGQGLECLSALQHPGAQPRMPSLAWSSAPFAAGGRRTSDNEPGRQAWWPGPRQAWQSRDTPSSKKCRPVKSEAPGAFGFLLVAASWPTCMTPTSTDEPAEAERLRLRLASLARPWELSRPNVCMRAVPPEASASWQDPCFPWALSACGAQPLRRCTMQDTEMVRPLPSFFKVALAPSSSQNSCRSQSRS